MSTLRVPTARVFEPLLNPSRYKGAHGGRGSGKSHFFGSRLVEKAFLTPGLRAVCVREVQKTLQESAKRLIEDKIRSLGVAGHFDIKNDRIDTPGGGTVIFQGMKDHSAESIKSLEGYHLAWIEEAQTLSRRSLELLRPTIRAPGSELWFSWNPRSKYDPVDEMFRGTEAPPNSICIQANWSDNPWFPDELETERDYDRRTKGDRYAHIWEGAYEPAAIGAVYQHEIQKVESEGRYCSVPYESGHPVHTAWDIGVGDSTAIWFVQTVGRELRIIDHLESFGVGVDWYIGQLKERGYIYGTHLWPHDGDVREFGTGRSRKETAQSFGFSPTILPNQRLEEGINAARGTFSRCWFDKTKTERGFEALRQYKYEYRDDARAFSPRPRHDWTSHTADAFRYLAMGLNQIEQVSGGIHTPLDYNIPDEAYV